MNLTGLEDRRIGAALYVMGLLEPAELTTFEAVLGKDDALQLEVGFWQDRLLGLTKQATSVEPEAGLWAQIEAALPAAASDETTAEANGFAGEPEPEPPSPVVQSVAVVPATSAPVNPVSNEPVSTFGVPDKPGRRHARRGFWNRLSVWRVWSAFATAAAVLLATFVAQRPPPAEIYSAVLVSSQQQAGWLLQAGSSSALELVPLKPTSSALHDQSLQLWTRANEASALVPLGLLNPGESFEIAVKLLPGLAGNQYFAISLEPSGGSPSGMPTGPILFAGNTKRL